MLHILLAIRYYCFRQEDQFFLSQAYCIWCLIQRYFSWMRWYFANSQCYSGLLWFFSQEFLSHTTSILKVQKLIKYSWDNWFHCLYSATIHLWSLETSQTQEFHSYVGEAHRWITCHLLFYIFLRDHRF